MAMGTSKMGGKNDLGPLVDQKVDRRKSRPYAPVIGDMHVPVQGNIEIRSQKNFLIMNIELIDALFGPLHPIPRLKVSARHPEQSPDSG
jgi:hypothetical protein